MGKVKVLTNMPSPYCDICRQPSVNFARMQITEGMCLDADRANAILSANKFTESAMKKGVIRPTLLKLAPISRGRSDKRLRIHVTNAAHVIIDWKANGIPRNAERYLSMFHNHVLRFIHRHHPISTNSPVQQSPGYTSEQLTSGQQMSLIDSESELSQISDSDEESDNHIDFCSSQPTRARKRVLSLLIGRAAVRIRKKKSLRDIILRIKTCLKLSDSQTRKLLNILREEKPKGNWAKLPKDARTIGRPSYRFLKNFKIRPVDDGFCVLDQQRIHPMLGNPPKKNSITKDGGDVGDFSISDSLFLNGPGMLYTKQYRHLLQRINRAYPTLLSPQLLRIADEKLFEKEISSGQLTKRPAMNYFMLKVFMDGVQIAKNSSRAQTIPVLAVIDSIATFNPDTKQISKDNFVRIPLRLVKPFIISVFHGYKKPDQFQFLEKFFEELEFLSPTRELNEGERRSCVVGIRCMICDTPMIAWATGE